MDIANTTNLTNATIATPADDGFEDYIEFRAQRDLIFKIFLELFTVLALVCIAANVLIFLVIAKYRRLQRDRSNVLLMHWTVLNTLFMLSTPTSIRLATEFSWVLHQSYEFFCAVEQVEFTLLLGNLVLVELLLVCWYLKVYHPSVSVKFERNIAFFIASVYVLCFFCVGLHVHSCYHMYIRFSEVFLALSYLAFIVFMLVMNVVHLVKRRKLVNATDVKSTPLVLANTYFCSIVPLILAFFLQFSSGISMTAESVIILICMILAVMNSIYFFGILYKFDKDFNTFLGHILTCRCRAYSGDELVEEPVVYNGNVRMGQI